MGKLISYAYLRTECDISQNIEDDALDNPIKRAQDTLRFLLGNALYDSLVSQNDNNSLSTENLALYNPYVKQFLAWQAYQFWLIRSNTYSTRTGMRQFREENSDVASDKSMGEMIRDAKEATNQYKGALLSFLQAEQSEDSSKYTDYTGKNVSNSMSSGFHITAIKKRDSKSSQIDRRIYENGE